MSSLTSLQKATAEAIVNVFETGRIRGDYGNVTLLPGDPGHLTYGRSQTTLASGNLFLLLKAYCEADGAEFADEFAVYLNRVQRIDLSLDQDKPFRQLLREAGQDPIMRSEQDAFFDRVYFQPALNLAAAVGIGIPLGVTVVYDSKVHGSWGKLRDRTTNEVGTVSSAGEKTWVEAYVRIRRSWLANHPIAILRNTVYRMDTFQKLIGQGKWNLELPLTAHGVLISATDLEHGTPVLVSADDNELPVLSLTTPFTIGPAVTKVQEKLGISADGIFGPKTQDAVKEFQRKHGLKADGIVGPATYAALGLN